MTRPVRIFWWLVIICFGLGAILSLVLFSLPFSSLKALADSFSRDGNFQSLSLALFAQINIPIRIAGLVLLLAALGMALRKRQTQSWLAAFFTWLAGYCRSVRSDLRILLRLVSPARLERAHLYALLAIMLLAFLFRAEHLNGPVYHDEAFTFIDYASHPVATVITDYSLPNNHIFHNLLVHIVYRLFGNAPWIIRLPAFFAGWLVVPAAYLLARMLYGKTVALLSAALLAVVPNLIEYSASARGYTLVALFSLLAFALGVYLTRNKNQAGWLLLVIFLALGFYTVPTMLYPFGILFTWFILTALGREPVTAYGSRLNFLKYVVAAGLGTFALTMALYTPVFIYSGIGSVFFNHVIQPNSVQEFLHNDLPSAIIGVWDSWTAGLPPIGWVFLAGFILSLVFHRRIASTGFPLQVAAILFPAIDLPIQRPDSVPRVWLFLLPLFLIWASAGLIAPFRRIRRLSRLEGPGIFGSFGLAEGVMVLGILGAAWVGVNNAVAYYPLFKHPQSLEEAAALYMKSQLQQGDVIAVSAPHDMAVIYYLEYHGVPKSYIKGIAKQTYDRILAAVYPGDNQDLEFVIRWTGIDPQKIDLAGARLLTTTGNAQIYECAPAR